MFRSEKAWNDAHQDSETHSTTIPSSRQDISYPRSLNMKQTPSLPSLSQASTHSLQASHPSCSGMLPNISLGLPSVLQPSISIPNASFSSLPTSLPCHSSMLPNSAQVTPTESNFKRAFIETTEHIHATVNPTLTTQLPRFRSIGHQVSHAIVNPTSTSQQPLSLADSSKFIMNQSQTNALLSHTASDGGSSDDENDVDDKEAPSSKNIIEIVDENGDIRQKRNMKVKDVFKLKDGEKILVHVNECGQPIEDARRVLTRWMTNLVKQPYLCPPDISNFHKLREICGCHLLRLIREKFSFPMHDNVDHVLMSMFDAKFRNNKHKIVKKIYKDAEANLRLKYEQDLSEAGYNKKDIDAAIKKHQFGIEELENEFDSLPCPRGFATHQWLKFLNYIKSPDFKRLSSNGKAARKKHCHAHTTGTTSFAQKKVEYTKNKKRKPGYIDFFELTHKNKKGAYAKDKTALFMDFAKEKMEEYKASGKFPNEYAIQREAWDICMGEDTPGRARGFGVGVTKSQVRGFRAELMDMRNEELVVNHSRSIENHLKDFASYKASTDATIEAMQTELQLYRTAYTNGIDPMSQTFGHNVERSASDKRQQQYQQQQANDMVEQFLKEHFGGDEVILSATGLICLLDIQSK